MNKNNYDETNWAKDASYSIKIMKFPNSLKFLLYLDQFSLYIPIMTCKPLVPQIEVPKAPPDASPNPLLTM